MRIRSHAARRACANESHREDSGSDIIQPISQISANSMGLTAGTKLGPYEIVSTLGVGGMGEVYRARDTRLGRDIAIKVLPESLANDADRLLRFEQEARTIAALNHPNILGIFDVGVQGATRYLVSELLEGETLRQKLEAGPLAARRATEYAAEIANGLAAAHAKGVIHRDLKPENIFIVKTGQIKILDFGLAKVSKAAEAAAETVETVGTPGTTPGMVMGTVGYMSPEQVRGEHLDHRTDIFSFGAVLYEMVSAKRAFQEDSAVETMSAILKEDPGGEGGEIEAGAVRLRRLVLQLRDPRREVVNLAARALDVALQTLDLRRQTLRGVGGRGRVARSFGVGSPRAPPPSCPAPLRPAPALERRPRARSPASRGPRRRRGRGSRRRPAPNCRAAPAPRPRSIGSHPATRPPWKPEAYSRRRRPALKRSARRARRPGNRERRCAKRALEQRPNSTVLSATPGSGGGPGFARFPRDFTFDDARIRPRVPFLPGARRWGWIALLPGLLCRSSPCALDFRGPYIRDDLREANPPSRSRNA